MATLEKLSILKAWAEVYIVSMIGRSFLSVYYVINHINDLFCFFFFFINREWFRPGKSNNEEVKQQ